MDFFQQNKIDRYLGFVDDVETALNKAKKDQASAKEEIELALNRAYSRAMVSVDDEMFKKITKLLNKEFDKKNRNRIYYLMRKDIFGRRTKISFEELINK